MKIFNSILFLTLLSVSTTLMAQTFKYQVSGKIGNLSAPAKAYLIRSHEGQIKVDSMIMKNGMFSFNGVTDANERLAFLKISKSGQGNSGSRGVSFYTDAQSIFINSADSVPNAKVIGGVLNRDEAELNALSKALKANTSADDEKISMEEKSAYINFLKSHPNSIISLKALKNISGGYPNPTEFEPLFNLLSAKVRATSEGQAYLQRLAGIKKVSIGLMAPDFTMPDTAGKPVSLHDFKGKYVLVDFWASWCPPCRAESPYLIDAYQTYKDKNFTILSVSLDNPGAKSKWIKAIQDDKLTWTQVSELQYNSKVSQLYSINTIPYNFLIGPDGKIVAKSLRGDELKIKLKELLDK